MIAELVMDVKVYYELVGVYGIPSLLKIFHSQRYDLCGQRLYLNITILVIIYRKHGFKNNYIFIVKSHYYY